MKLEVGGVNSLLENFFRSLVLLLLLDADNDGYFNRNILEMKIVKETGNS